MLGSSSTGYDKYSIYTRHCYTLFYILYSAREMDKIGSEIGIEIDEKW